MAVAGLYRRLLPSPPAIEFASPEGKQLFSEALLNGTMEGFFRLISYFQTQSEPAYCGLASLSVVLNALAIDPGRKWKGPWRWFDETMLDCCEPLEKVKEKGITFGKVACLASCAGAKVETFRSSQSSVDDFRRQVIRSASSEDCHIIASYHRKHFKQTGTGHFSPIGGYHAERDMALILDVARFKYPPHWVPLSLLWEAMDTLDEATGLQRGFMVVSKLPRPPSLLYTLSCRHESWLSVANCLIEDVPLLLESEIPDTVTEVLRLIFSSLPASAGEFIKWVVEVKRHEENGSNLSAEEKGRLSAKEVVMDQVRATELFKFVSECLSMNGVESFNGGTEEESLPEIAANICCQGAQLLTGNPWGGERISSCSTCVKGWSSGRDKPLTIVSGTVVSGGKQQGVDVLVPTSPRKSNGSLSNSSSSPVMHPANNDVLTVLVLALPPATWSGIKNARLLEEIRALVSAENLPDVLQDEVLHLRRQLHCLKEQ
ncbi:glutathione gamma-glutamylcysteinyltransferase 1-like [Wolffia australiana]